MSESQFELRLKEIFAGYSLPGVLVTMGTTTLRVYLKNYENDVILAEGNVVPPDGGSDYAKGCLFVKNDAAAGSSGIYENWGTKTSCAFKLVSGAITVFISSQHTITEAENVNGLATGGGAFQQPIVYTNAGNKRAMLISGAQATEALANCVSQNVQKAASSRQNNTP